MSKCSKIKHLKYLKKWNEFNAKIKITVTKNLKLVLGLSSIFVNFSLFSLFSFDCFIRQ